MERSLDDRTKEQRVQDFRDWADARIKAVSRERNKKLKLVELAEEVGTSPAYLSLLLRIETEQKRLPDLDTVLALGTALGDTGGALRAAYGPIPSLIHTPDGERLARLLNAMGDAERGAILALLEARAR